MPDEPWTFFEQKHSWFLDDCTLTSDWWLRNYNTLEVHHSWSLLGVCCLDGSLFKSGRLSAVRSTACASSSSSSAGIPGVPGLLGPPSAPGVAGVSGSPRAWTMAWTVSRISCDPGLNADA